MKIKSHRGVYNVTFNTPITNLFDNVDNKFFIIDKNIKKLFPAVCNKVKNVTYITAKEDNKNLEFCTSLIDMLLKKNIKKNHTIIAIGGGITQDITCFIASTLFRGIDWYFVPTTLLAQADSCIGSKSSINFKSFKNLLGGFYPPKKILCSTDFLTTLSKNDVKSGLGEILHFLFVGNSKLLSSFQHDYNDLVNLKPIVNQYIKESLTIKKYTVEKDEFDTSTRQLNNFGHTFGHALETATQYRITHGQAITIGMSIANYISYNLNFINEEKFNYINTIINCNKPDVKLSIEEKRKFFNALKKDKKNINNSLVCILHKTHNTTKLEIVTLDNIDKVKNIINNYFAKYEH
jgi:3-dehydroquinate synthase|tara:strand:- start:515 stop:1561 length:1047 start_codon:yes stop_codon:yes gene_type:complete